MPAIDAFAAAFTELTDTPGAISSLEFARGNAGGTALEFFDLFGSANTWSADQSHAADIVPAVDTTRNVGTDALRFEEMHARLGVFVGGGGTRTFGANQTGLMAGEQAEGAGAGTATHRMRGTPFPAVALIANAYAGGSGSALVANDSGGSSLFGSAYASAAGGDATVRATQFGNFTSAYAYPTGTAGRDHLFGNYSPGAILFGYSQGNGTVNVRNLNSPGAFTSCRPTASGANTAAVLNQGDGAFLVGRMNANGADVSCTINGSGDGGFLQGFFQNGATALVSAAGAFLQGRIFGAGSMTASGLGSLAHGNVTTGAITASGAGAFAVGDAGANTIAATAANASQFGPGTNALSDSLQVGNGGLRLKGTTGAPGAPQNGDMWVSGGYVYIRSNGVSVQI